MGLEKTTPEEWLLKIIENPIALKNTQRPAAAEAAAGSKHRLPLSGLRFDRNILKRVTLRSANKVIIGACVVLTFFWVYDFLSNGSSLQMRAAQLKPENLNSAGNKKTTDPGVNPDDVLSGARSHNIFGATAVKTGATPPSDAQAVADMKLVGILWSDNPQAMVEDTKAGKTYLVYAGEKIGAAIVKKILKESIVVGDDTWEKELR